MEKYDIQEVAKWILSKEELINHKRLQKYLYLFYGDYLAIKNTSVNELKIELFHNDFEGWIAGIISPTIYELYKNSGYKPLSIHYNYTAAISRNDEIILNKIYTKYKNYTTDELEKISQIQMPWVNSRRGLATYEIGNKHINEVDIYNCFNGK